MNEIDIFRCKIEVIKLADIVRNSSKLDQETLNKINDRLEEIKRLVLNNIDTSNVFLPRLK